MKKVLVVDDEEDILELWMWQFKQLDIPVEVHSATNGQEALTMASTIKNYDFVITDYRMPQMDGLEFIKKLRQLPNYKSTPVLFFTGYLPELKEHSRELENVFLFEKPLVSENLETHMKMCLKL